MPTGINEVFLAGRNRIKSIHSNLFNVMVFLNAVVLESNQCINENFFGGKAIIGIGDRINNRCKFDGNSFELACYKISDGCIHWTTGLCCDMSKESAISTSNAIISGVVDPDVIRMHFSGNKAIRFLPISLSIKFPNIIHYWARGCFIQKISKLNFFGLESMTNLWLGSNEIDTIRSDTFEGLDALENIGLGKLAT